VAVGVTAEFEAQRGRLFGLAYRLLGSAADAEDVVQDAYLRWHGADHAAIGAPAGWLAKVVTNLALNRLASARARRERYVGPWLPEPVLTEDGTLGPLETAQRRELVSLGLLVLLERLTPAERAVFVLREAFGYGYRDIAGVLERSEPHCRQLDHRARQRIGDGRPRFTPGREHWQRLVERFLAAAGSGDVRALERLLAADATSWADGGGKVTTARRPVHGRSRVARYLAGAASKFGELMVLISEVNGEPAVLGLRGTSLAGALVLEISGGEIAAVRIIANPEKLGFLARQVAQGRGGTPAVPGPLSRSGSLPGS
jgi:RNA polymerase sigma-70 factor (TIGR02957 family)